MGRIIHTLIISEGLRGDIIAADVEMSVAFSNDGSSVIGQQIESVSTATTPQQLQEVYELERCVSWIQENGFTRVGLQFPDALLPDSVPVSTHLHAHTDALNFILADTSYGSCCVDEVAAEHYTADALIHFGHACLSPTRRLPLLYVFGRQPLDVNHCCQLLTEAVSGPLLLVYDVVYHQYRDELESKLKDHFTLSIAELDMPKCNIAECSASDDSDSQTDYTVHMGRRITLPSDSSIDSHTVCYIGEEGYALTNWILHYPNCDFYTYTPTQRTLRKESLNINRFLMKRFQLIEKAKDAQIIGLLVGTLGVADYVGVLDRCQRLAEDAGKKTYTFVVGKVNVPKLANFMEVDLFVLVACAESSLLDSAEFYRPVITPYELEVACNQARQWTGKLVTDFMQLLPGGREFVAAPEQRAVETDVSLVTGRLRTLGVARDQGHEVRGQGDLATQTMDLTAAPSAGAVLSERSWQGLDPLLGQTPVEKAKPGRRGIAMGYTEEIPHKDS